MDLVSQLAHMSLSEIASMLNPKQQEVLLASISVAASYIQQIEAEEQQLRANAEQQQLDNQPQQLPQQLQQQSQQQQNTHHNHRQLLHQHLQMKQDLDDDDLEDEEFDEVDYSQSQTEEEDDLHSQTEENDLHSHHHNHHHRSEGDELNSTADEKDKLTIKQFADELKYRRKSIRLSQKGAAQSLRAFTDGEQPCTDAIIYHFENLQLEPDRAIQLIPLLRDWLEWAEKHRLNGKQLPMLSAVTKVPRERKRKVVLFNEKAKQYLEDAFAKNNHPDRYQLDVISQELNIPTRSIRKWFTNRRQRKRFAEKFSTVS